MPHRLSRAAALEILELDATATRTEVKLAYRRLARTHHPDAGGDAATFADLQRAYERLQRDPTAAAGPPRARPARGPGGNWGDAPSRQWSAERVDPDAVDWGRELPVGARAFRLDRSLVAVALDRSAPGAPIAPLTGRSRGPRSTLNRFVALLDPELTAQWRIAPVGTTVDADLEIVVRCRSRRARRRADAAALAPGWVRHRGSSTTTLTRSLHPSRDRHDTAVRAASRLEEALDALAWPLSSWWALGADLG